MLPRSGVLSSFRAVRKHLGFRDGGGANAGTVQFPGGAEAPEVPRQRGANAELYSSRPRAGLISPHPSFQPARRGTTAQFPSTSYCRTQWLDEAAPGFSAPNLVFCMIVRRVTNGMLWCIRSLKYHHLALSLRNTQVPSSKLFHAYRSTALPEPWP